MNSAVLGMAAVARLQWRCCIVARFWIHEKGAGRSEGIDLGSSVIVPHEADTVRGGRLKRTVKLSTLGDNKRAFGWLS
jgi:hypothetical protein